MASEVRQLDLVLKLQDQASKKLSSFSNELGLLEKAGNAAKTAFLGIGAGLVGMGGFAIKSAADMEKMRVSLNTSFKGNAEEAKKAFDTINEFTAKTPFQLEEVMTGFIKLKNMGLDPSKKALTSYGDTASAMGKSLNQMIEAVADAATGEFERLKEFGIKTKSEGDKVTFTFRGVSTTVGKNAKEIEDYLIKLGETEFAGGMEQQSKTLYGVLSTLKDQISLTFGALAEESGVMEVLKNVINDVANAIDQNKQKVIDWVKEWVKSVGGAEGIKGKLDELWNTIKNSVIPTIVDLSKIIMDTVKFIWEHRDAIVALVLGYESFKAVMGIASLITAVSTAMTALSTGALTLGGALAMVVAPATLIAIGIGLLVAAGYLLYKNWDVVKEKAIEIWGKIKEVFFSAVEWIKINVIDNFIKGFDSMIAFFVGVGAKIGEIWESIKNGFMVAWTAIKNFLTATLEFIVGFIALTLDLLIPGWEEKLKAMYDSAVSIWTSIKTFFSETVSAIAIFIKEKFAWLKEQLSLIWEFIKDIFVSAWNFISIKIKEIISPLIAWVKETWTSIKTFFSELWDSISSIFSSSIDNISGFFDPIIEKIKWVIETVKGMGGDFFKGIGEGINAVRERGRSVMSVNDAIISPNGNIITTDPKDYLIATKKPGELTGGGGGVNVVINYPMVLDRNAGDMLADVISESLRRKLRI